MIQSGLFWIVLGVSVVLFWTLPLRMRMGFLALVSAGYMATIAPWSIAALLVFSIAFYYLAPLAIVKRPAAAKARRLAAASDGGAPVATLVAPPVVAAAPVPNRWWVLPILISVILAYLLCFKYLLPLAHAFLPQYGAARLAVPLGISYFTFKLIHYAKEIADETIQRGSLGEFYCYIFLFPTFTAGPIERFDHLLVEREHHWKLNSTVEGCTRIIHGLIKKFVLGATIIAYVEEFSAHSLLNRLGVLPVWKVWAFLMLSYVYFYLDFSAYSDIAIGASRLFGLKIEENFNHPLTANNIADFWRRWHITLTKWCQTYVYMPMLGLFRSPYVAVFATFSVIGLWHAGSVNWLAWGLWHATGISLYQVWLGYRRRNKKLKFLSKGIWKYVGILPTFLFVAAGEMLTLDGMSNAYDALRIMLKLAGINLPPR